MLVYIFVYKLVMVSRKSETVNKKNQKLVSTITKATLLTMFSIFSTLLNAVVTVIRPSIEDGSSHIEFMAVLIYTNDVFTNFLSIILGYRYFEDHYLKICGCCDAKCKLLCHNMVTENEDKIQMQLEETSAASSLNK